MAFNTTLYPKDILNPTAPYVYFTDAPDDILNVVSPILNQNINTFTTDTGETNIKQAFDFLQKVIISERAKENAFLAYLKNKTKTIFDLKIPSLDENWTDFVREVQQLLDIGTLGLQDLQNEYNRLVKNNTNYQNAIDKGLDNIQYEQDTLKQTQNDLKNLLDTLKQNQLNFQRKGAQIIKIIVENFGADLFTLKGDQLLFNRSELMALLLSLSQMISQNYQTKKTFYNSNKLNDENKSLNRADALDDELKQSLQTTINQFKMFPTLRKQMVDNYGLLTKNQRAISITKLKRNGQQLNMDPTILTEELFGLLKNYQIPDDTFQIIQKEPALAEIRSALNNIGAGAVTVINPGSINAKPDNVIAYLTGDLSKLNPLSDPRAQQIINKIEKASQLIEKNMLDKQHGGLSNINTAEYYKMREIKWNELKDELSTILQELSSQYEFLSQCFLIEDSTKNYLSLYTQTENNTQLTGPHGGSLGANLNDQLLKIEQLTQAGNITMVDRNWLFAAILNSGPNMIANEHKRTLEDYLAMFAAMLLFDSQLSIANDAIHLTAQSLTSNTGVFNIHLFSVNGGYYPLSYVLKLTYDSLVMGLEQARTEAMTQGVEVDIYGYINHPTENGPQAWIDARELAKKTTKIKMRFMVKLMNVISNLLNFN